MNAVEIEEAVSELAAAPFDREEFPYAFLTAFGNKDTTVKRLRSGQSNASDIPGAVLQRNNIHIAVSEVGGVGDALARVRQSPKTQGAKAKFILATDGVTLEAEDLTSGEVIACAYAEFAEHFGFFLPLAGISTVKEIKNNPIDVKATGRLNKLYVELLRDNPKWGTEEKRPELNQFMARLIFCFFAEDTGIFRDRQFTRTIDQMSDGQSGNTHEVLTELFRAMDTKPEDRKAANLRNWADAFPYVNGGLFTGATECPRFSRIARSYLLRAGELDWQLINPDIFGSMIQAVADDDERGELGMHYTSVPNILKVLNPLFLDDLREQLEAASDNLRKLRNLRKRLSTIRVFDPACGSGNFLVIAYKEMRAIEAEIVKRTGDKPRSQIPLSNFYGIELKSFAAEIARLALLIAEFQADCIYINQHEARMMVLPLHRTGQIKVGNALRERWLEVCPSAPIARMEEHDLAGPTGRLLLETDPDEQAQPETYICGNPPYAGLSSQSADQKDDLGALFAELSQYWKSYDYVSGWIYKASEYARACASRFAFVTTNSVFQGQQVPMLWPLVLQNDLAITFAYESFKWSNLASNNAGVTVVVVGVGRRNSGRECQIFVHTEAGVQSRKVNHINAYLAPAEDTYVDACSEPKNLLSKMYWGCKPVDDGNLILSRKERDDLLARRPDASRFVRPLYGSSEFIDGVPRQCIWVTDEDVGEATAIAELAERFEKVRAFRAASKAAETRPASKFPHKFRQIQGSPGENVLVIPIHSSENREWLPVGFASRGAIITNAAFGIYSPKTWTLSLLASRMHLIWIATVCGRIKNDYRYSNTLGWNTFPAPVLTDQNKKDLTRCAENILLAREAHFPATIADLYDPNEMPNDLRRAHDENDEALERIYVGRRFRNDTERLERLFDLYTKMTAAPPHSNKKKAKSAA